MKTKEELNAIKEEVKALNKKLAELNEEELVQVLGGAGGYTYVFTMGETIWANSANTRYFRVNEDVATNQAEQMISVTQVTPGADMFEPQQITMSVRTLKDYLDRFGKR